MESRTPSAGADELYEALLAKLSGEVMPSAREAAAVDFVERLAARHHTIDDGVIDGLRGHFSDPEIVELGLVGGAFIMFGRLNRAFDVAPMKPGADLGASRAPRGDA